MTGRRQGWRAAVGVATILVATMVSGGQAHAEPSSAQPPPTADPAPPLLDLGAPVASEDTPTGRDSRKVEVDTSLLRPGTAETVSVDVGTDDMTVDLVPSESGAEGWSAWSGVVDGDPASSVTIIRDGEDVAGVISSPEGVYRLRNVGPSDHVLQEIGTGAFVELPGDAITPPVPTTGADHGAGGSSASTPPAEADPEAEADLPTYPVIRVLVGYTPQALAAAGSLSNLNSEAALAVATSNTAYQNSGVAGRLELAGTVAVSNNWGPDVDSLSQLTDPNDGTSDGIHTTRNSTGADLVTVLTSVGGSCGIGWLLNGLDPTTREGYGFSVVEYACAVDNLSFPHELGHNMGLEHDHYVSDSWSLFEYAFGYVNATAKWRTIMAYNDECADLGFNCTRIGRFSNPAVLYGGAPTGRPYNGSNPADNARALNNSQATVSLFRSRPAPFTSWAKFVAQQWRDFAKTPNAGQQNADASGLTNGTVLPAPYINLLMHGSTFGAYYEPVARLYFAYFLRPPDKSGLDYWVNRRKAGASLNQISASFAASSEFKRRYGSLGNRAFVELVYANVLGRAPDPAGLNFWTGELDSRKRTRGEVMTGFSESSEYRRKRAEEIDAVLLYRGLLGRGATTAEFNAAVSRLEGGTSIERLILEVLDSSEYAGRATL